MCVRTYVCIYIYVCSRILIKEKRKKKLNEKVFESEHYELEMLIKILLKIQKNQFVRLIPVCMPLHYTSNEKKIHLTFD